MGTGAPRFRVWKIWHCCGHFTQYSSLTCELWSFFSVMLKKWHRLLYSQVLVPSSVVMDPSLIP